MEKEREILSQIESLREPRHLFVLPDWADPAILDRLISEGYATCKHQQRDESGRLHVVMDLRLTPKGTSLLYSRVDLKGLAIKGSLAGASLMVMSLLILYLG